PGNGTLNVVNRWPRFCSFQNSGANLTANETQVSLALKFCGKEFELLSSAATHVFMPAILFHLLLIYFL
ncbi:unnamed protein product, partial [Rotaria sp. Silwood2]